MSPPASSTVYSTARDEWSLVAKSGFQTTQRRDSELSIGGKVKGGPERSEKDAPKGGFPCASNPNPDHRKQGRLGAWPQGKKWKRSRAPGPIRPSIGAARAATAAQSLTRSHTAAGPFARGSPTSKPPSATPPSPPPKAPTDTAAKPTQASLEGRPTSSAVLVELFRPEQ